MYSFELCLYFIIPQIFAAQSQILQRELSRQVSEGIEYFLETENSAFVESFDTPMRVLKWPIIDQFTVESGITKIKEYLSTWHFNENWKHCVNYLYQEADAACSFFRYEVFLVLCSLLTP